MVGCGNYDYQVNKLKQNRVKFEDLLQKVKSFYLDPSESGKSHASYIKFACLYDLKSYILDTVDTWIGPWVAYSKLTDKVNNISYRIDQRLTILLLFMTANWI